MYFAALRQRERGGGSERYRPTGWSEAPETRRNMRVKRGAQVGAREGRAERAGVREEKARRARGVEHTLH